MSLLPTRRVGDVLDLADEMDLVMDPWTRWPSSYRVQDGFWHPTTNVYDRNSDIVVELELPGVEEKDISVSAEDDELIIKGTRHHPAEYKEEEECVSEMSYGKFHRIIDLPGTVDTDNVKARFRGGMLTVTLPKKQKERGKKILLEAA